MTPEELMIPRVEVIMDYPNSPYVIGDIYKLKTQYHTRNNYYEKANGFSPHNVYSPEKYPAIFKPLQWWEERKIEDMPEYVLLNYSGGSFKWGSILKPLEWGIYPDEGNNFGNENNPFALIEISESSRTHDAGEQITINCNRLIPATKEEYEAFKNRQP